MMFTIFDGEKYVNKHGVTDSPTDNIILDVKSDFLLKKLENCTILDAIKALFCARKNTKDNNIIRLIYPNKFNILRKNCFYLQQIQPHNFYNISTRLFEHNLFILEEVVATICSSKIYDDQGWIYVAKHSKWRIICGYGKGVIVSRSLPENANINAEIERTLVYLRRFNLGKDFHIFRLDYPSQTWKEFFQNSTEASAGICSLAEKLSINPIQKKKYSLEKQLNIVSNLLFLIAFILVVFGVGLHIWNAENFIKFPSIYIENKNIRVKITRNNINKIEKFFEYFHKEFLPWNDFKLIRKIFPGIIINKISVDKNVARIYTTSSIEKNEDPNIFIEKQDNESVICIKK